MTTHINAGLYYNKPNRLQTVQTEPPNRSPNRLAHKPINRHHCAQVCSCTQRCCARLVASLQLGVVR